MSTTQPDPTAESPAAIWKILNQIARRQKQSDRLIQETDVLIKETAAQMKETDARMKETDARMKETAARIKETDAQLKENAAQMKETDRRLRRAEDLFTTQWGRLMESLVEGDLAKLLQQRGVAVEGVSARIRLRCGPKQREVDLLAMNGDEAVAVEVKTTLRPSDVDKFLGALEDPLLLRHVGPRRLYGGVAYLQEHQGTARYAERKGLFVIRATGSSASIVNPPEFRPRAFGPPAG